jgi:hypothetical protein
MATLFLTLGFVAAFFILMSVRLIIKKEEFKGTCASQNPFLQKQGITCGCGDSGSCKRELTEVEKVLARFDGPKS